MAIKLDKSNLVRNMARKYKLVTHLEKEIAKGEFAWNFDFTEKEHDDAWHPSGDCTPSLHDLYLKASGALERKPFSGSLYKTFMVGHFWHQYLQWVVEKRLEFCGPEDVERQGLKRWGEDTSEIGIYARPYHWARGMGDLAPCAIPGFGEYVVDFKTMGSHDFKPMKMPDWCAEKYECQINIYMDFFDLEKGLIVAISKDSPHDFKEFEFVRNQPLIDAIYEKWQLVAACLDAGVVPPLGEEIHLPTKGPIA